MTQYIAREYTHDDPMKLLLILDKVCDHRPWFNDHQWKDKELRYTVARRYLADAFLNGKLWEVYAVSEDNPAEITGIMVLNVIDYYIDARCHFIFFDHKLASKRQLCLEAMQWAFNTYEVHALRIEIPTYAHALIGWARRKLGFRYEAEARPLSWPKDAKQLTAKQSELGSRRYQATLYEDSWHDVLTLSVTREEFEARHGRTLQAEHGTSGRKHSTNAGVERGSGGHAPSVHAEPASDHEPVPADECA